LRLQSVVSGGFFGKKLCSTRLAGNLHCFEYLADMILPDRQDPSVFERVMKRPIKRLFCGVLAVIGMVSSPPLSAQTTHGLLREVYEGIGGTAVSDLTSAARFPDSPSSTGYVTDFFEAPTDVMENYGQRLRGYIIAPLTGNYTFWFASDDGGQLWLSTDDSPVNRKKIAEVTGWTNSREWTREAGQKSSAIALEAGRAYYVEALMKEAGGGDNLAVRWLRPDGVDETPIPAEHLLPWGVGFKAPEIVRQPRNLRLTEGGSGEFDVVLDPLSPADYQWRQNGVNLPGANGATLEMGPAQLRDSGARYSVFLSNSYGDTLSTEATLTVIPDVTAPVLIGAESRGPNSIRVLFSEPIDPVTGGNVANFQVSPGVTVQASRLDEDPRQVLLSTSALAFGQDYQFAVTGVTDRAAAANTILPGSRIDFVTLEYTAAGIGEVDVEGRIQRVGPGQFDLVGGGALLAEGSDQFEFAWEERTGNFDVQVRVADVEVTDPYFQAGLMVRESLEADSRFAAIFASSAQVGCLFASRTASGAVPKSESLPGGYPVNYPETWLRLRRSGSILTGFASLDGRTWTQLGSATYSGLASRLRFGMALASASPGTASRASFRDLGDTASTAVADLVRTGEAAGPVVRSSGLVLSEIHYHPRADSSKADLEFVEIYNAGSIYEDFTGFRISGEIDFEFPAGFRLPAGAFVVVAANPAELKTAHGLSDSQVLGPFTGSLPNEGGTIRLRGRADDVLVAVTWQTHAPWPIAADGAGPSLVLHRPSYGPSDPRAWKASSRVGGSPGSVDPQLPSVDVLINELLAHTDEPDLDFVELYHPGSGSIDLSGYILTDDPSTNGFRFPEGTSLAPQGHLVIDQIQLGFRLDASGERVFLLSPDADRVIDAVRFGAQENGVSFGRQPDGSPTFRRLAFVTPGTANATWRQEEIVINELMYNPISHNDDDEYVELHNRSGRTVDLGGWRFTDGIDYRIPEGTLLGSGGYLVVARNAERLRAGHPELTAANSLGNFKGSLSNSGERIALAKPDTIVSTNQFSRIVTNLIYIDVAEVTYVDGGRWGEWADGGGSSLELIDPNADPLRAPNWADSDETEKGRWSSFEFTGRLDNGNNNYPPNQLQITLQGGGEAMVDEVEVIRSGNTQNLVANGGFESGSGTSATGWTFQGNHDGSFIRSSDAAAGSRALHITTQGRGDTGYNRIRTPLASGLSNNSIATIRARVRWVKGWPEVLFRIRGNWMEMPVSMLLPTNLGTPGRPNSRRIENAGPAIFDVTHSPALPQSGQTVLITARISDPDGIASARAIARVDGSGTVLDISLRDDGSGGDAVPGDGLFSGQLPGRSSGTLMAFRIEARDSAARAATRLFPSDAPARECLVRWGDPVPAGSFGHYHMWSTATTEANRRRFHPLNNVYNDLTFVYGNDRVIYNAGFKDKGSPFHGGGGDFFVVTPSDDPLLGGTDLALASTGNGGSEPTQLREITSFWIAREMGVGYLHRRSIRLYRNGSLHRDVTEDAEEPNGDYAERFYSEGEHPDLYKIEDWFEFQDNGTSFNNVDARLQRYTTLNNELKLARYRWSWRKRAVEESANDYSNLLELVETVNTGGSAYVDTVLNSVDVDNWMRTFAFQRICGNWDSYGFNRGKNMYAYKRDGAPWRLFSWDVDFTLGLGASASDSLWGANDPTINRMYDTPAFRRMLWQAYRDAADGPLDPAKADARMDALNAVLRRNGINAQDPRPVKQYLATRRQKILADYARADTGNFAITSGAGADITTSAAQVTLTGSAPLAVRTIAINGIPYPVTWTSFTAWSLSIPLTEAVNRFHLTALDRTGTPLQGLEDTIQVTSTGNRPQARDFVSIHEIQYHADLPGASFMELYNRSTSTAFDLSGVRLDGAGYTFPPGALIQPNAYLVLVANRAGFAAAYGDTVPAFDEFPGNLDNGGERFSLVQPDPTGGTSEILIDEVRFDNHLPWPENADGFGPSLQLIDAAQDNWRVGNWRTTQNNDPNRSTPGRANVTRATLEPFPRLWINEVLAENFGGPVDNQGEREPFIELFNAGSTGVDLSLFHLTDSYTNLARWQFPGGTSIGPGQFLRVWADGEPAESVSGHLHTNFRLTPGSGSVALVRTQLGGSAVVDYLNYRNLLQGRSFGLFPNGNPTGRRVFQFVSPGEANNPAVPDVRVTLNEFLAGNRSTLADPADGDFEDWFELYNSGNETVDLSGYHLTDRLTDPTQFRIPAGTTVPAGGYLLVWADGETGQNQVGRADLHVNFRLSTEGEPLALFDPNGMLIDSLTYETQVSDVSSGRYPDGETGSLLQFSLPTPGAPNFLEGGNVPPRVNPIAGVIAPERTPVSFTVTATEMDATQTVRFSLADAPVGASIDPVTGVFAWTPTEDQGPVTHRFTVRATDNGTPARSGSANVVVTVTEVNSHPRLSIPGTLEIDEGSLLSFDAVVADPDLPANQWTFALVGSIPEGAAIDPDSGVFAWSPSEEQGPGLHRITLRVTDNGEPPQSDEQSFEVTVHEANNPPVLSNVQPQTIDEGETFRIQVQALDPDTPPVPVRYSLGLGAPAGMTLDPATGDLEWSTTEDEGPATYVVTVTATETGGLSDTRSFGLTVQEVNQAPTLSAVPDWETVEGAVVAFRASAGDADRPAQKLTFSLADGAPAGAEIDPNTGDFLWSVPLDRGSATDAVTIVVTDSRPGSLAARQTFRIVTRGLFRAVINEIMHQPLAESGRYVELVNPSSTTAQNLSGIELRGLGIVYAFANGTLLEPGGFLCVAENAETFRNVYGPVPKLAGAWSGSLGQEGDLLRLVRPGSGGVPDEVLDSVRYEPGPPWPSAAAGQGASLQLIDPLVDNDHPANWSAATTYTGPRDLLQMTGTWKYYQDGPLAAAWRSPGFDDGSWSSGPGLLYVEGSNLPAPKNTALKLGQLTYYFRTRFTLPSLPANATLQLSTIIDDGAVFYLNGQEIHRENIDPGAEIDFTTSTPRVISNAALQAPVSLPGNALISGENVFAVEVHQNNSGSSDIVFGAELRMEGGSVSAFTPGAKNNIQRELPAIADVILNEVYPGPTGPLTDSSGEQEPWIELHNRSPLAAVLTGWTLGNTLTNPGAFRFPEGTSIPADGYLVVIADGEPGESSGGEFHTSFRLDPSNGIILLSREQPGGLGVIDYIRYSGGAIGEAKIPNPGNLERLADVTSPSPGVANELTQNRAPMLTAIGNQTLPVGRTLDLTLTGSDPDGPFQTLRFELLNAPDGMMLDHSTGHLLWTPDKAGRFRVTVQLVDDGIPVLGVTRSFTVVVEAATGLAVGLGTTDSGLMISWPTTPGKRYRLEVLDDLGTTDWASVDEYTANTTSLGVPVSKAQEVRFFRVVELP
jgi:hypothetical protein